jgi:NAD(P)-dependent dehydrogenase (short-subunit alcohol dehydrogenase family)
MACRDLKRANDAADDIRRQTSGIEGVGEVLVVHLDLASFASVRECAQRLLRTEKHIHLLVNNAGESQHAQDSIPGNGNYSALLVSYWLLWLDLHFDPDD